MATPRVKIVSDGMGHSSQVFVRQGEAWVEISNSVSAASINVTVGEVNRATLEVLLVGTEIEADLHDLVYQHVGRSHFGRLTWRLRKWWWRVRVKPPRDREVTVLADHHRRYVA